MLFLSDESTVSVFFTPTMLAGKFVSYLVSRGEPSMSSPVKACDNMGVLIVALYALARGTVLRGPDKVIHVF